jgi:hypothetical protein
MNRNGPPCRSTRGAEGDDPMLRQSFLALSALALLTTITATANAAGPAPSYARNSGSQHQIAKPKFEDIKLQTGMGASAPSTGTVRGGGFFQSRDQGG